VWQELLNKAEAERAVLCKHLDGQALFLAVLRMYAAIHRELRDSLLPEEQPDEFREQRRRKRHPSTEDENKTPKTSKPTPGPRDPRVRSHEVVQLRNYFAPLRATEMEVERTPTEETSNTENTEVQQQQSPSKSGRPPPIVLTSTTNLIQLQRQITKFTTGNFEFRNTRNGTRIVTKEMADFSAFKKCQERTNFSWYSYFPESENPLKAVIRHFPSTPRLRIFQTDW
jgi:hypothetical protein